MSPAWSTLPTREGEFLLWASLALLWMVVNYLHRLDPLGRREHRALDGPGLRRWRRGVAGRSFLGGLAVLLLAGPGLAGAPLAALFLVGAAALPLVRAAWARGSGGRWYRDLRPEWELAANATVLGGAALLVGGGGVVLRFPPAGLPEHRAGIVLLSAAAVVFLMRGGTHVVRGVLEKSDTLPREASARGREDDEVRHGMTIGNLERFLVFTLALLGHLGVLGFVVGAKGLVRAVEWRERPMLEYFLVGTLASVTLALVLALAVRWVALALW